MSYREIKNFELNIRKHFPNFVAVCMYLKEYEKQQNYSSLECR
jgi:hypothetical protein